MEHLAEISGGYELPSELREFQEVIRRLVDRELIPIERQSVVDNKLKPEIRLHLARKGRELGIDKFDIPEKHGGLGLGLLARVVFWEQLGRTTALPARADGVFGPELSPILYSLDHDQAERFLLPSIRGDIKWCFAQTEADAGSDPAAIRTTATLNGDHYVLNGTKRFITGAGEADFAQVVAVTDKEKGSRGGISVFILDMKAPGVKLLRQQQLVIDDRPWEIAFENVEVPVRNRVGSEGDGFAEAQRGLSAGRLRHGAKACGVIERCIELGAAYAKQRKTFGAHLADRQIIQWMLADAFTALHQLRLMVYHAAAKFDRGEDIRVEAYMAKVFGDKQSFLAADNCMQIHGGTGFSTELPIEAFWRNQRSMMVTEGPNEVLHAAVARHVLRRFG